jgi:hypothetical protein
VLEPVALQAVQQLAQLAGLLGQGRIGQALQVPGGQLIHSCGQPRQPVRGVTLLG